LTVVFPKRQLFLLGQDRAIILLPQIDQSICEEEYEVSDPTETERKTQRMEEKNKRSNSRVDTRVREVKSKE
jgi:hypothetical protein